MTVPTVDTLRNGYVVRTQMRGPRPVMLVGNTGTGKTVLAESILESLNEKLGLVMNFSSATSSNAAQDIVEGSMEKRSRDQYGPPGGRSLVLFVDDFNMPKKDEFGSQPRWNSSDSGWDMGAGMIEASVHGILYKIHSCWLPWENLEEAELKYPGGCNLNFQCSILHFLQILKFSEFLNVFNSNSE